MTKKTEKKKTREVALKDVLAVKSGSMGFGLIPVVYVISRHKRVGHFRYPCCYCVIEESVWQIDESKSVIDATVVEERDQRCKDKFLVCKSQIVFSGPRAKLERLLEKLGYATLLEE
ncbi:MAG: hypothetical protein WC242_01250 [Candidatus Paceibacterota bacterium]|jgi:hypothetical protein